MINSARQLRHRHLSLARNKIWTVWWETLSICGSCGGPSLNLAWIRHWITSSRALATASPSTAHASLTSAYIRPARTGLVVIHPSSRGLAALPCPRAKHLYCTGAANINSSAAAAAAAARRATAGHGTLTGHAWLDYSSLASSTSPPLHRSHQPQLAAWRSG